MKHFSCTLRLVAVEGLSLGRFEFGQDSQVVGDYRAPYVLLKPFPFGPGAPSQSKSSLPSGNVGLNSGSKILKLLVNPEAFDHLQNRKSPFLGERNIFDAQLFG